MYYDLLNLYGENANTRSIVYNLKLNNIKVKVDYRSLKEQINFDNYDIVYIGSGSEDNLKLALKDIMNRKKELTKYINSNGYLILTGNAMDLFGKYIKTYDDKLNALGIFDYHIEYLKDSNLKNASTDRIVGEVSANSKLVEDKIIGFQNRCDLVHNVKTPLFQIDENYSNDLKSNNEGFTYKNVYATHIIGPLLIRNPHLLDYILDKLCKEKKIKYNSLDATSKTAYKKYLENFS
jgi:CobQ-like glutamine amidotransferase family enzyme